MAKRAAPRGSAPTVNVVSTIPMENQSIESDIDMKLSKQDLIDMVIEENREIIENKRDVISAAVKDINAKVQEELNASRQNLTDYLKSSKRTYLKRFEALGEIKFQNNAGINRTLDQDGIIPLNDHGQLARKVNGLQYSVPGGLTFFVHSEQKLYKYGETPPDSYNVNGQLHASDAELNKIYAPLCKALKEYTIQQAALTEVNGQLNNVDKMGKRAKAQLIKTILGNSTGGKAVLDNLTSVKASIAQALLGPANK